MAERKRKRPGITDEHKAAITAGRTQHAAIAAYLDALGTPRRPGPRVSADKLKARLKEVAAAIETETGAARRLHLVQERMDLEVALAGEEGTPADALAELEAGFIEHAQAYSERKGITYAAWREVGVPARVLRDAGIGRGGWA